ncbi:MAG: hypothetical protein EZS28_034378, partial [Streblomastix strix]
FPVTEKEAYLRNIRLSLEEYNYAVKYYDTMKVKDVFEQEISMCRQMVQLLPFRIEGVNSGRIALPPPIPAL